MATININIADAQLNNAIDSICAAHDYQDLIDGGPNPESKAQFARRMVIEMVKNWVKAGQLKLVQGSITPITEQAKVDGETITGVIS